MAVIPSQRGFFALSTFVRTAHGVSVPVMIVGRLAVDARHHGQGIGGGMLRDAFQRILQATEIVGCRAVLVHAIDDAATTFYARYGFVASPAGPRTLFLPVETLRAAL